MIREMELLREHPCFSALTDEEYQKIQDHMYKRTYKKGQVLFDPGDERNRIFFLNKGLVKFEKSDQSDAYFYLDFVRENNLFPYSGLFDDDTYYFSAIAMTDIEVSCISANVFEEAISQNSEQLIFYVKILSKLVKHHELKIQGCISFHAFQRVKHTLGILMNDLGEKNYRGNLFIPYPIQMNDIARSSGTTRETASLAIKKMVKEKKIQYIRKELIFYDVDYFLDFLK